MLGECDPKSLRSFLKETQGHWKEKELTSACEKLARVGIESLPDLVLSVRPGTKDTLNSRLRSHGEKCFCSDTITALAQAASRRQASLLVFLKGALPDWTERKLQTVQDKLAKVGILDLAELLPTIRLGAKDHLQDRFVHKGEKRFAQDTLDAIRQHANDLRNCSGYELADENGEAAEACHQDTLPVSDDADNGASARSPLYECLESAPPQWSPADLRIIEMKLAQVGIYTVEELHSAVQPGSRRHLNKRLRRAGLNAFRSSTFLELQAHAMRCCSGRSNDDAVFNGESQALDCECDAPDSIPAVDDRQDANWECTRSWSNDAAIHDDESEVLDCDCDDPDSTPALDHHQEAIGNSHCDDAAENLSLHDEPWPLESSTTTDGPSPDPSCIDVLSEQSASLDGPPVVLSEFTAGEGVCDVDVEASANCRRLEGNTPTDVPRAGLADSLPHSAAWPEHPTLEAAVSSADSAESEPGSAEVHPSADVEHSQSAPAAANEQWDEGEAEPCHAELGSADVQPSAEMPYVQTALAVTNELSDEGETEPCHEQEASEQPQDEVSAASIQADEHLEAGAADVHLSTEVEHAQAALAASSEQWDEGTAELWHAQEASEQGQDEVLAAFGEADEHLEARAADVHLSTAVEHAQAALAASNEQWDEGTAELWHAQEASEQGQDEVSVASGQADEHLEAGAADVHLSTAVEHAQAALAASNEPWDEGTAELWHAQVPNKQPLDDASAVPGQADEHLDEGAASVHLSTDVEHAQEALAASNEQWDEGVAELCHAQPRSADVHLSADMEHAEAALAATNEQWDMGMAEPCNASPPDQEAGEHPLDEVSAAALALSQAEEHLDAGAREPPGFGCATPSCRYRVHCSADKGAYCCLVCLKTGGHGGNCERQEAAEGSRKAYPGWRSLPGSEVFLLERARHGIALWNEEEAGKAEEQPSRIERPVAGPNGWLLGDAELVHWHKQLSPELRRVMHESGKAWDRRERFMFLQSRGRFDPTAMAARYRRRPSPGSPRISVVVPTMEKRHAWHQQLFDTFNSQTWPDKELIVLETYFDKPSEFLEHQARVDERVIYVSMKVERTNDLSIGLKRNICIHLASGTYIANFDDDDLYAPCYLSKMTEAMLENKSNAITLGSWYIFDCKTGRFGHVSPKEQKQSDRQDKDYWSFGYGFSYLSTREVCLRVPYPDWPFNPNFPSQEDWEFFTAVRMLNQQRLGQNVGFIPFMEPSGTTLLLDRKGLCVHTLHSTSTSASWAQREVQRPEAQKLEVAGLGEAFSRLLNQFPRRSGASEFIPDPVVHSVRFHQHLARAPFTLWGPLGPMVERFPQRGRRF